MVNMNVDQIEKIYLKNIINTESTSNEALIADSYIYIYIYTRQVYSHNKCLSKECSFEGAVCVLSNITQGKETREQVEDNVNH